jgi:D-glycero-D-manno-heptose 1,7-bisphosphate phosphatase
MRRAAFLDRDGTLNERPSPHHYVLNAEGFRWIPGAAQAVARLFDIGYEPIVVSNQRGIARGLVSRQALSEIEAHIRDEVARHGGRLAAFYYCPHEAQAKCFCRKPAPGLILRAAADQRVDTGASVMIGDSESDVEAGQAAGCATVRIAPAGSPSAADLVVPDLASAAEAMDGPPSHRLRTVRDARALAIPRSS